MMGFIATFALTVRKLNMKKLSVLLVFAGIIVFFSNSNAQTITSSQSGSWNDPLTWSGVVPDASNSTSIIVSHDVSVPSGYTVSIDQTTISTGASLIIDATGVVTIANGTGNDLTISSGAVLDVSGTLINANSAVISGSTTLTTTFQSGSIYEHQYTTTQGSIPLAVWDGTQGAASTIRITGYTTLTTATAAGNWGQSFGNVEWNCAAQTATLALNGLLTTVQGNLDVVSTGTTGVVRFATTGAGTVTISENFNLSGDARIGLCTTGTCIVNVAGDYTQNLSAGYMRLSDSGSGTATINLSGNFDLQAGIFNGGATGRGNLNFVGSAGTVHTFTEAGTPTTSLLNTLAYTVAADNELNVVGESQLAGGTTSFFTLGNNAVLRVESTDAAGAIQTGTAQGAATGNLRVTTANRVYNAGSRIIYNGSGAQFMGNGQPTVAGITTEINNSAGVTQVAASTLSILGNVTLQTGDLTVSNAALTIGGTTDLQAGDILFTSVGTARSLTFNGDLTLSGNISVTSGTQNANVIFAGDITGGGLISFTGVNSNVTINGSGDLVVPLSDPTSLETLTNNRTGAITFNETLNINTNAASSLMSITAGNVTVNGDLNGRGVTLTNGSNLVVSGNTVLTNTLTITNGTVQTDGSLAITNDLVLTAGSIDVNGSTTITDDLTLGSGTIFFFEDQSLTLNSQLTNNGGFFSSNSSSTLNILNAGILGTIAFDAGGNTLGTFVLNRATTGTLVTLNSSLTVDGTFDLLDGIVANTSGLGFGSGAVLTRNSNASFLAGSAIPVGGPYDLLLTGATMTTGVESQGSLNDVTSTSSGTVTLGGALTAQGTLLISSGTFTSGANGVSVLNFTNNGTTFNASSTTLSIDGDLVNNGAFNRNNGTVDFSGVSTISGSVNPTFQNVIISGTLTAPATLNLTGNFTNNGVFNPGTGTVVFTSTANGTKTISGSQDITFNNVTIQNNTANPDASISGNVDLLGVLTLNTTAVLDADDAGTGVLTIISSGDNPTVDGSIATLTGTSAVTGNVTVERFMSIEGANGGRIYRYVSTPVQNALVSDIQAEIPVTGTFTGTSTCTGCATDQSLFQYDENVITDTNGNSVIDLNDGYVDFPSVANTEVFTPGRGYTLYVRGNVLSSALWNLRGPINQGNVTPVSFAPTFTSSGVAANDGWNLVGNPYASTIDWNAAAGWTKTNIGGTIYIRDNGSGGVFATWNGTIGTNGGSRYIPMGQGFWIQATGTPTLTANENVKVGGQQTIFLKEAARKDLLRITMVKGALKDETVIHFRKDAKENYDPETDSRKFANTIFNLSTVLSTGEELAINSSPFVCSEPIKLKITNASAGTYQLNFSEIETFEGEVDITLIDHFLNKTINVTSTNQYAFSITSSPASFGANRFSLSFSEKAILDEVEFATQEVCEGENASISILNSSSNVNYLILKDGLSVSDSVPGNGATLNLLVGRENLTSGLNSVIIQASSERCMATKLYEGSILYKEKPSIETTSGEICKEGEITLTASTLDTKDSFMWFDDLESELVIATTSSFTTPVISKSRTYYVAAQTTAGCLTERKPVSATVIQFEDVVLTEGEDGLLHSSYDQGNTWFFNGEQISGATLNTLSPEKSGTYKVEVSTESCSSSAEYEFVITALEEQSRVNGVSVYPNPVADKLYIDVTENKVDIRKAVLYNNIGTIVAEAAWMNEAGKKNGSINMNNLPSGVYIVRLYTSDRILSLKVYKK